MALTEKQKEMANAIMKSGNSGGSSGSGSGQKSMFASSLSDDEKEIARLALQKVAKKDDYETVSEMKNAYETVNTLSSKANDRESRIALQKAKYALQDSAVRALGLYGDSMGTQDRNIAAQALEISKSEMEQDVTRLWDKSEELQQAGKQSGVKESAAKAEEEPVILTDENGTNWKLATKKSTAGRKTGATGILSGSVGVKRDGATLYGFQKSLSGYKTYHQETVPAQDKDTNNEKHTIRNLKANTDIQLQKAAIETISENAGKTYYELKEAYDGSDDSTYIGAYKKLVLEQLLQDSRTSEIITGEITEAQAALMEVYAQAQQTTDSVVLTKLKSQSRALREQIDTLTGERWTVQQKKKYEAIPTYSDFAKNSVADAEGKGKKNDQRYLYINNINGARGTLSAQAMIGGRESYEPYSHMTETEIGIYNYLYNVSGKKDANGYLEYLIYDLNERSASEIYDSIAQWTQESKWNAIGGSVASVITNLGSGIGYMDVLGQKTAKNITGSEKPVDYNKGAQTGYVFSQGVRDTVLKNINSNAGRFIYSTAMSMADSLGVMAASTVIGPAATVLLGGSAATSTMHEVREKGGTERQALAMGFAAGAAETLAEKLPLENLMNMKSAVGLKDVFINVMKQAGVEASEEFITSLANTASEALILGDKSSLQESYNEYLSQGYTPEEAEKKAKADWVRDIALDAAGGFVSGLLFAGGKLALNARGDARRGKNISSSKYTLDVLIDEVLEGDYSDGLKEAARKLRTKQHSGDKISNGEKGRFASLIEQDNPNFVFEVLPGILEKVQQLEDMEGSTDNKNTAEDGGDVKFALENTSKMSLKKQLSEYYKGKLKDSDMFYLGDTPGSLYKSGFLSAPLVFGISDFIKSTKNKHNIPRRVLNSLYENLKNPLFSFGSGDRVGFVINDIDGDGKQILVGIKKNTTTDNRASNTIKSVYGLDNPKAWIENQIKAGKEFVLYDKERANAFLRSYGYSALEEDVVYSLSDTLSQSTDNVNTKFETTEKVKGEKENARGISGEAGTEAGDSESILSDGGRGRFSETYTGEGRPIQERDGSDNVERAKRRAQKASKRQSAVAALRGEAVSAASLGIKNGSDSASARIMPESTYDNELRSIKRAAAEDGIDVQFFVGGLTLNDNSDVDAVAVGDKFYIKADKTTISASELYDHERFHKSMRKNKNVVKALALWITKNFNGETFSRVFNKYYDKYAEAYKLSGMTPEEASFEVVEEMLADAYAGTNRMGEDIKEYTTVARAVAEDTDGAGISEYNANQGRAPPQGITYEGIKQAIREIVQEINADTERYNESVTLDGAVKFSIDDKFEKLVDNWDRTTTGFSFVVGETSEALQKAGIPNQQIRWDASKIKTLLNKHSGMTLETVKQIPQLLENPVIVIDSKQNQNAKIVMGDLYDNNGKVITTVLLLTPTSKKGNTLDLIKISSAEGRSHIASLFRYDNGDSVPVRYVDKNRIQSWLNVNRLQLPLHNLDSDSITSMPENADNVNTKFAIAGGERVSQQEINAIQSIGRKSVNDFSSEDIQKTERYARRYWNEMGTKSPFFRAWLGDWRAYDTTPVEIATKAGVQRGSQYNNDTGWNISISAKVFNETGTHSSVATTSARPYLDYINDIVKKAVLLDSYGVGSGKAKSANTLLMHSMYALADIGNGPEVLKLYVEEMNDPNSTGTTKRSYQLQNIEKYQQSSVVGSGESPSLIASTADVESVSDLFEYVKSKDPSFKPKQVASALLNEDGTPMVLYHGTEKAFYEFKNTEISSKEGSFFFAQNYEDAAAYTSTGEVMEVYVSLQNPIDYNNMPTEIYKLKDKKAQVEALKEMGYDGWYADMDTGWGEVSAFYPEQVKSATDNTGTFDRGSKDIRFAIAGEKSRTADINALQQAQEMEQNGYSSEEIHSETGWYRGSDGYWRYEIDDSGMEYHSGDNKDTALSEIITHDELFKAYPELMNVNVVFDNMPKGVKASYSEKNNTITLSNDLKNASESSLIHEIQHAIQSIEGFSGGANAEYWQKGLDSGEQIYSKGMKEALQNLIEFEADPDNKMAIEISKDLNRYILEDRTDEFGELSEWAHDAGLDDKIVQYDDLLFDFENEKYRMTNKDARELYENTAGEIEARDTAKRQRMSADERREAMPNTGNRDTVFAENSELSHEEKENSREIVEQLKDNIPELQSMEAVAELTGNEFDGTDGRKLSEQVEEYFDLVGNTVTRRGFGVVELNKRGIKSDIAHGIGRAKAITFAAIPQVIEYGNQIDYAENWKGRGADSYVFAAPVDVGGQRTYVAAVVLRGDDTRFYLHEVVDENGNIIIIRKNSNSETIKTQSYGKSRVTGSSELLYDNNMPENTGNVNTKIQKELSTIAANGLNHSTIYSRAPSANTDISQNTDNVNVKINEGSAIEKIATSESLKESYQQAHKVASPSSENLSQSGDDVNTKFALSDDEYGLYDMPPEERTLGDVKKRKLNAFCFDHGEVMQYYKPEAQELLRELSESTRNSELETDSIMRLTEEGGMTYPRIRKALRDIISNPGDEKALNRADVKRVEIELDTRLREGYTDRQGVKIPANSDYVEFVSEIKSETSTNEETYAKTVDKEKQRKKAEALQSLYDRAEAMLNPNLDGYEESKETRERLKQERFEKEQEADNYFYSVNKEEIDNSESRLKSLLKETDPKKRLEYYVDIVAEAQANKERQLRGDTIAKAAENDGYIPDGVEEAEIAAAQELYKQKLAAEKAADEEKYKGMTVEEAEAFKEVEAKRKRAEWLEGAEKKNFIGSEAMKKLGIKISKSTANYKIAANLLEQARANAQLVRDMERQLRKMHATSAERMWAQEIIDNTLDVESLPRGADIQRILEASDYLMAKNAARTDLFAKQKVDIRDKARQLAQEKFKNAENAKRISSAKLDYMTPKRAMETMFGEEQGGEIYRTFFESVRENDAEKIRFAEKLRQEAAEIEGADGKKGRLTKGERAVTQMLMEGKAAAEMIARLEIDSRAKVEKAGKRLASGEALSEIKDETVSEETDGKKERVYTVGEDSETRYSTAEIDAALRYAAEITADEAIKTGTYKGESIDTVRVNNAAKYFSDKYDLMYDAINEFLVAHGEQPIGFIKGYAPHTQAKEALEPWDRILQWMGAPTDINELRADIAGETHLRKPNRKWNPHFLNRGYASETDYDVYRGYEDYVDYVSEVFYHMDDIMRLRAASQYLRTMYTTEESRAILNQIEEVRKGNRFEKLAFLQANNQVNHGQSFIGTEIDEALDKYADSILRDEENKTAVGSSLVMWLDNYTNLLAGKQNAMDRGLEQRIGRNGIKRINKIINYTIAAQVVGNVSSALNQFAQLPFAITELGAKNTALAIYDIVRNPQEMRRFSMDNDFLTARKGTTILDYKVTDRVTNAMAKPLEVTDWLMSEITARAAYHQGLSQGMDTETAMKYSVQKGEDIMGSRNKASKPVAFTTKNPMFRLINAYQIEALNQWQHIIRDLPKDYKNIAKSKGAKAAAGKLAKDIVTYLICAALINRIADEIYGGSPAPLNLLGITGNFVASGYGLTLNEGLIRVFTNVARGETDGEFDWAAAGETLLSDILDEVPMLDNVLAATGLSDDDTVFVKSVKNLWDGIEKANDHFFVTKEERESGEQESAEIGEGLLDLVIGASGFIYGGNQLKKTIRGVKAVAEHGNKNESGNLTYPVESNVGNFIKGALFGPSALSKAQEYYASGASPLTSKRNEQYYGMIDMGVDEYDAYKIVQELADVESDKDENGETVSGSKFMNQMNYIESCEVSDDVKDYLALSMASDSAYDRYVENELETQGVDPAEFMLGWAFYRSTTGKDKQQQTRQYLKQQGIDEGVINKIISGIK